MKQHAHDFALLGGQPLFAEALVVGRPNMPERSSLLRRIEAVLDSGWLSNGGPLVNEFETELAKRLKVKHAVAVCNGTVALQVMAKACGLTGEVIVPSMTFVATPHAMQWIGLTPVFADINWDDHTLDPSSVERCITPRTSAILAVHLWGNSCRIEELQDIADRHGLRLLFDASHAFGCEFRGRPIANFGIAEAFSFHATKVMHAAEGGAIVTNDDKVADECRLMRNFGITDFTHIDSLGTNAKMNELCAAAGLTSLESIDDVLDHNHRNMLSYREMIDAVPGLRLAIPLQADRRNNQYAVVCVSEREFGLSRNELTQVLRSEGVFARSYFSPGCHNAAPYVSDRIHSPVALPVTDSLLQQVMQLPTGPTVTTENIQAIGELLLSIQRHAPILRDQLADQQMLAALSDAA